MYKKRDDLKNIILKHIGKQPCERNFEFIFCSPMFQWIASVWQMDITKTGESNQIKSNALQWHE